MAQGGFRVLALAGVLAVGGAALAGCGGGSSGRRSAAGASSPTTATTAPATTVAPSTTTTLPAPATTVPATTVAPTTVPTSSPSSSGSGPFLIVRAFGGSVGYNGQRPTVIDFSSDSTNIVTHLTWSTWGPSTAVGTGQLGLNTCQPNCAQGTVTQVPVTIDLSAVVSGHFTAMTEKATGVSNSYSYPSNWPLGAS